MRKNKDNPVPSINDVYEFMDINKNYKSYSEKQKTVMIDSFYLMLNTLNLNGVETNKEQPMECPYDDSNKCNYPRCGCQ